MDKKVLDFPIVSLPSFFISLVSEHVNLKKKNENKNV